jgi:hypothetical protein
MTAASIPVARIVVEGRDTDTATVALGIAVAHVHGGHTGWAALGAVPCPADPTSRRVVLGLSKEAIAPILDGSIFASVEGDSVGGLRVVKIVWIHSDDCDRVPARCACGLGLLQELKATWEAGKQ